MYEHIEITQTPLQLGYYMAKGMGWPGKKQEKCFEWLQPGVKIKKHQLRPAIYACKVMLIIYGVDWSVHWYIHDHHLDGVTIVGWPDEQTLSTILAFANEPGLKEGYELQRAWLAKNPMYRSYVPGVKSSKRDDPRGYMITSA